MLEVVVIGACVMLQRRERKYVVRWAAKKLSEAPYLCRFHRTRPLTAHTNVIILVKRYILVCICLWLCDCACGACVIARRTASQERVQQRYGSYPSFYPTITTPSTAPWHAKTYIHHPISMPHMLRTLFAAERHRKGVLSASEVLSRRLLPTHRHVIGAAAI